MRHPRHRRRCGQIEPLETRRPLAVDVLQPLSNLSANAGAPSAVIDLDAAYVEAPVIEVRIAEGDYEIGLKDGWTLERDAGPERGA